MIQANELRVGNIVSDFGGREARVSAITERGTIKLSSEHYTDESFNLNERVINPIPLTEEWLLRFGFDAERMGDGFLGYRLNYVDISMPYFEFTYDYGTESVEVKYVHQIQNLYFALTGTELKLKS